MAQQVKVPATKVDDLSLILKTHMEVQHGTHVPTQLDTDRM